MTRKTPKFLMAAVLAFGVLALVVSPIDARPRGGHGGRGGHAAFRGGFRGGRTVFRGGRAGFGGFRRGFVGTRRFGRGFVGTRRFGRGFVGTRRFGRGFFGRGFGLGYGLFGGYYPYYSYYPYYGYNSYYPYYGYGGYAPYYTNAYSYLGYTPYNTAYSSVYVTPSVPAAGTDGSGTTQEANDNQAHLLLIVPENAEVWIEGQKMTQTGTRREFVSPVLTPGGSYTYTVRVRTPSSDETRAIHVKANDRWSVDFTKPAPAASK